MERRRTPTRMEEAENETVGRGRACRATSRWRFRVDVWIDETIVASILYGKLYIYSPAEKREGLLW